MNKPVAVATLRGLSIVLLSGCGLFGTAYMARDMKPKCNTSETPGQE
jgi:hypothetical protein